LIRKGRGRTEHWVGVHDHPASLLGTRYRALASNTIDYWMLADDPAMTAAAALAAFQAAPVLPAATLSLYIHVPFCAQRCRFCAFSGGNSPDTKLADRYATLLVAQLHALLRRCPMHGHPIRAVNIGGGSPDLLGPRIDTVLAAVRRLPGFSDDTELAVELTLSTVRPPFLDMLAEHGVTKVSFGVQSTDHAVRGWMRQPRSLEPLDRALQWMDGRFPVVNADLITGMPGQSLASVEEDLERLMTMPGINAISSYLLTAGAAPSLLAATAAGTIPAAPDPLAQALMRLATIGGFRRARWVRRGTNTYVDPRRVPERELARMAGNECIGASHYEAFLLGVGPQAVTSVPGARIENVVDVAQWCDLVEAGAAPFFAPKCATIHQRDMALWTFPLRWEGLPASRMADMLAAGACTEAQLATLAALEQEGLVHARAGGYCLSLLGEVFMGQLVRDLKGESARRVIDDYIAEGAALAAAVVQGRASDGYRINNRQLPHLVVHDE
jgi:oxygen-independent coproporphyrinogen-3 oxidase